MTEIDPEDHEYLARVFGIAHAMAREIMWENDEGTYQNETPEQRFDRMLTWANENLLSH